MEGLTKEEETSYNTNNNKDYICSDDDYNNRILNDEEDDNNRNNTKTSQAWGTWEELLLACAVKRHGFSNWDSVATEVRSRTSISSVFASANDCRLKYRDLKRRFHDSAGKSEEEEENVGNTNIPWLEQLRGLRVAELRRQVQQYDVSILSLQLKVKKLEDEKEKDKTPDLEDKSKPDRSDNDFFEHQVKTVESDRDNRSMNESNSTDGNDPDLVTKEEGSVSRRSEGSHSGELGESGTSGLKREMKRRKNNDDVNDNHGGGIGLTVSKSQPLMSLLDVIRSHPRGSLFECRLRSQESEEYNSMVKQHLDIETIHKKLNQGSYDSSSVTFYRDLQLLFTNAIFFFPLSSSQSMAAYELRTVVTEEIRKETGKPAPMLINREALSSETSDSSLSRLKSWAPLVVCNKRSVVSPMDETLSEEKENVTGVRSSRRANKGSNKQRQTKEETGKKTGKKKSVADFLKRLKNSPQKDGKEMNISGESGKKESKTKSRELRSNNVGKKKVEEENTIPVKRAPGRPQKKTEDVGATPTVKRGRESGSMEKDNKKPKKRSRR